MCVECSKQVGHSDIPFSAILWVFELHKINSFDSTLISTLYTALTKKKKIVILINLTIYISFFPPSQIVIFT